MPISQQRRWAAILLALAGLLAGVLTAAPGHAVSGTPDVGNASRAGYTTLSFPGERSADLYVPPWLSWRPQLWIALHGAHQKPSAMEKYGISSLAAKHGFIVVYPEGWKDVWHAGTCCFSTEAGWPDEVAFIDEVVAKVREMYPSINPNLRVVGFSNGAMMALTYACDQPRVTAVASVAGAWVDTSSCDRKPLVVHAINAVPDAIVPYYGGYSPYAETSFPPATTLYTHFPNGTNFSLHTIDDSGHDWPNGATQEVWDYLL